MAKPDGDLDPLWQDLDWYVLDLESPFPDPTLCLKVIYSEPVVARVRTRYLGRAPRADNVLL